MEEKDGKDQALEHAAPMNVTAATSLPSPPGPVSDPEEDDLDELDDMLDEFSSTKIDTVKSESEPLKTAPDNVPKELDLSDAATEEFSKQLQEQMAALLSGVDETPEMRKEIENMMQELGSAADPGPMKATAEGSKSEPQKAEAPKGEDGFQETIRKTMERMQYSGEQASAAAAADDSEDILAQMLKEMQSGNLDGADGEENFSKMLMGMMEQLTNKEILYEPMKELHDRFPGWMAKNKDTCNKNDLWRYEEQQRLVSEIVGRFEEKGYSDSKAADREYIVERMQQMQSAGSPPSDLVGDMSAAQEALGNLDAGCPQQ